MKRVIFLLVAFCTTAAMAASPMGTSFTYQGRLNDSTIPANGEYQMVFRLFDAAVTGTEVGPPVSLDPVLVTNGFFSVYLDFGANSFKGNASWLEISLRPRPGAVTKPFVTLAPRQFLSPVPQAQFAATAAKANSVVGDLSLPYPAVLNFGMNVRQMINLWDDQYGIGVQANVLYNRTHMGFAWFKDGTHSDAAYNPGVGGTMLMKLDSGGSLELNHSGVGTALVVESAYKSAAFLRGQTRVSFDSTMDKAHLRLEETQDDDFARLEFKSTTKPVWHIAAGGNLNFMNFWNKANGDVMSLSQDGNLYVKVLTITGGADLAEPFEMSSEGISSGAVVVIDHENPGQLRMSNQPYDTRVAGVVSGANGIKPGLSLCQQGALERGQQVALTGRVYVQADATDNPIRPGDLLTSSATPGHAMRVTDYSRAQGAVIGKAMTGLSEGKGLVLVLVSLQ